MSILTVAECEGERFFGIRYVQTQVKKMMGLFQHTRISEINEFISALRLSDKRAGVRNLAEFVDGAWVGSESTSIYAEGHPLRTSGPG